MRKLIISIIAITILFGLFFITACTSNINPNVEVIPTGDQSTLVDEFIETTPEVSNAPDLLTIMAEEEIVFAGGESKFSPGFVKKDISEIEAKAIAIVKATAISAAPNPDLDERTRITLTTIRIDEVIMSDGGLKVGDEKVLVEYYRIYKNPKYENLIFVSSSNDSMPMRKNRQYLLFLQKPSQTYGDYSVVGAWQGKYPITYKTLIAKATDLTREDLEITEQRCDDRFISLAQQVFDKYLR